MSVLRNGKKVCADSGSNITDNKNWQVFVHRWPFTCNRIFIRLIYYISIVYSYDSLILENTFLGCEIICIAGLRASDWTHEVDANFLFIGWPGDFHEYSWGMSCPIGQGKESSWVFMRKVLPDWCRNIKVFTGWSDSTFLMNIHRDRTRRWRGYLRQKEVYLVFLQQLQIYATARDITADHSTQTSDARLPRHR